MRQAQCRRQRRDERKGQQRRFIELAPLCRSGHAGRNLPRRDGFLDRRKRRARYCSGLLRAIGRRRHNSYPPGYELWGREADLQPLPLRDYCGRCVALETTAQGCRFATSGGGVLTGRGADIIIIDDPLKPEEALSETQRRAANEWFDHTLYSRQNDKPTSLAFWLGCRPRSLQRGPLSRGLGTLARIGTSG
jgi:hypothetical protein